jgi:hypothetical protein
MTKRNKYITALLAFLAGLGIYIGPKPSPSPVPAPAASPVPLPTPVPSGPPQPLPAPSPAATDECNLPPMNGPQSGCEDKPGGAQFRDDVAEAQEKANDLFLVDGRIADESGYTAEISRLLRLKGYCSKNGLPDETWVKNQNGFSEHWDVVSFNHEPILLFAARCRPAGF